MNVLRVFVEGVGLWSPELINFAALRPALDGVAAVAAAGRPGAALLPSNERRRAPESVLLAVEVAGQAIAMSGRDATGLACVFSSAHGDQAITDYMCATLAQNPTALSPTRFHNSVHNAPVGYWTIATGCHAPSTAVCAQRTSFGAGLLEAASQVVADRHEVLLVCSDIGGTPPLSEATGCTRPFGCALVLAPERGAATLASLDITPMAAEATFQTSACDLPEMLAHWHDANPSARALPLLALLTRGRGRCRLDTGPRMTLQIAMEDPA